MQNAFGSPDVGQTQRHTGLSWLCALSSFVLLGLYLLLGLHLRLSLGHWPTPMYENFSTPLFEAHMEAVRFVMLGTWWVSGPLWLVCLLIRPLRPYPARVAFYQLATFFGGYLLIFAVLRFDPTTFSAWFLD